MPKKYLTVNEVANIFGITPLTVRNWDKKGSLAAYRNPVNNYRMYKIEDVEVLMRKIEHSKPQTKKLKIDMY
jgi:DNA (cytosine-5)-methyltransferase 1